MSGIKFRPVQGTMDKIKDLNYAEGYIYFATDTGKIYLDADDKRISMGGNSGIFYGNMIPPEDTDTDQKDFVFLFSEIDGDQKPNTDDLILNIPDGCFYRVENIIEEEGIINATKLTIAGSGGGGGGATSSRLTIQDIDGTLTKYFTTDTDSAILRFNVSSNITEDNFITSITYTIGNIETYLDNEPKDFGIIDFNLLKYIPKMSTTVSTTVKISVEDNYGTKKSIEYRINVVELTLESEIKDSILYTSTKTYTYFCSPKGGSSLRNRKVIYTLYDSSNNMIVPAPAATVIENTTSTVTKTLDFSDLSHGVYTFTAQYVGETAEGLEIKSNILKYQIINYVDEGVLLTAVQPAATIEQYSYLEINYMIGSDPNSASGTSNIILSQKEIQDENAKEISQVVTNNVLQKWRMYLDTVGTYEFTISIGSIELTLDPVRVIPYSGDMPTINENDENLILLLKTTNRSNNDSNKNIWQYKDAQAELKDFYWGEINGWMVDEDNENMLHMTAGANLEVANCYPFAQDAKTRGLTIELDFKVSGVIDFDQPLIKCLSYDDTKEQILTGFQITGQESTMNSFQIKATGGEIKEGDAAEDQVYNTAIQGLTTKFTEDERIHLSWVIERTPENSTSKSLVRTYLNGIMSGITQYNQDDRFIENKNDRAILSIDSTYADIDIYNIRIYNVALDQTAILNNYIATSGTVDDRVAIAADNDIVYEDGKINPEKVFHEEYQLSIPYLKLVGGTSLNPDDKWQVQNERDGEGNLIYRLPEAKKDYRLMSVEFIDPSGKKPNWKESIKLKNPSTGQIVNKIEDAEVGYRVEEGCQVYGQGTSSMEYPVKNLRIKFKQKEIEIYPGAYPVDLICCKADYMESSSSHNTGTGNLVYDLYKSLGNDFRTPAQEFYNAENWGYDIVTAIKGFPIAIFWSADGEKFEYVGKYNFNMDKATQEPFGFVSYDDNNGHTFGMDGYEEVSYANEEEFDESILPPYILENNKYVEADEFEPTKTYYNRKETIHCIEFLNNSSKLDNFLKEDSDGTFEESFFKTITSDGKQVPNWTTCFESRYPEDATDRKYIESWFRLCNWVASFGVDAFGKIYQDKLPQFKEEFEDHFNLNFTLFYYILTHVLLMIDSRAKNMMMATWDDTHWYPIFYDMDTMLGLNNYGYNKFNYTAIDTEANLYNSQNSVLWKYFREAYKTEIDLMYNRIRKNGLNYDALINYYNVKQADSWNEALYNADITYKYIRPFSEGYFNSVTGDKIWVAPGEKNYLYAAQGRRSMHRKWWLKNRLNFFDGMHLTEQYKQDFFGMRLYSPGIEDQYERDTSVTAETYEPGKYYIYNQETEEYLLSYDPFDVNVSYYKESSGAVQASIAAVPPNNDFYLTPLHDQYLSVAYGGENGQTVGPIFTKANNIATIKATQTSFTDTETYIYGGSALKDLGDLSPQYLGRFVFPNKETKLERLIIGNPHNDYYNSNFSDLSVGTKAPYLQELNIMNCRGLTKRAVDIGSCRRLKKLWATGSGLTSITLPKYGIIEELRLPDTLTTVIIVDHHNLTNDNFTIGSCDYNPITKEYNYINNYKNIQLLWVENTPIDTYSMIMNSEKLLSVSVKGFNWTITSNSLNNGQLEQIDVLEKIKTKSPFDASISMAASISGNIHLAISGASVEAIDIYNKYWKDFPNVTFTYDTTIMEVNPARTISFLGADELPYWSRKIANNGIITSDFFKGGPDGELQNPTKASSASHIYTFSGKWADQDGTEWTLEDICNEEKFGAVVKDWIFTPIFNAIIRNFMVSFKYGKINADNGIVEEKIISESYSYGSSIVFPTIIPYKDDSGLNLMETYMFKGWTLDDSKEVVSEQELNKVIVNQNNYIVTGKLNFTPVFVRINVKKAILPEEYFDTNSTSYTDRNGQVYYGITIKIKTNYILQGKITIPEKINNVNIIGIGQEGFREQKLVTHIFWENGENIKRFEDGSFYSMERLKHFEMPSGIEIIGTRSFLYCYNLEPEIISSPRLFRLEDNSFNSISRPKTDRLTIKIGGTIEFLGERSFGYNSDSYKIIQIGGPGEPSQLKEISNLAFELDTLNQIQYDEIIIYTDDVGKEIWKNPAFDLAISKSIRNA